MIMLIKKTSYSQKNKKTKTKKKNKNKKKHENMKVIQVVDDSTDYIALLRWTRKLRKVRRSGETFCDSDSSERPPPAKTGVQN